MISAVSLSEDFGMEYIRESDSISISAYLGDEEEVTIPSEIEGLPVKKIMANAFSDKKMRYVFLPRMLEEIDHHAFSGCNNLQSIEFPGTLKSIGNYAFYNCWEMRQLHLPSRLKSIGFGAFMNCEKLTELIQDKEEGREIGIGSIINGFSHQLHVEIRHIYPDREPESAKVIFTEYGSEVVTIVSICKRDDDKPTGTGTQMRYCVGSQDIDYHKYDGMFPVIQRDDGFDTVITVAVERLMFPYGLTQEYREKYIEYIGEHAMESAKKMMKDDEIEKLKFITELDLLKKEEIDQLIEMAISGDKTEYTAFLMDYRHKNFSMTEESFEL